MEHENRRQVNQIENGNLVAGPVGGGMREEYEQTGEEDEEIDDDEADEEDEEEFEEEDLYEISGIVHDLTLRYSVC